MAAVMSPVLTLLVFFCSIFKKWQFACWSSREIFDFTASLCKKRELLGVE